MKTTLILLALVLAGCNPNVPHPRDSLLTNDGSIAEYEYKGHRYIRNSRRLETSLIHAEHCPCKAKHCHRCRTNAASQPIVLEHLTVLKKVNGEWVETNQLWIHDLWNNAQ